MSWGGSRRLTPLSFPTGVKWAHYTDDITLTCEDLLLLRGTLRVLLEHLQENGWVVKPQNSRPRHDHNRPYRKVMGVIWSGKTCVVPDAVFGKMQTYPTPKNIKEMQGFVGIWGF